MATRLSPAPRLADPTGDSARLERVRMLAVLAIALCAVVMIIGELFWFLRLRQGALTLGLLFVPLAFPAGAAWLLAGGARYYGVGALMLAAMLAGQLYPDGRRHFPFANWSMYSTAPGGWVVAYQWYGVPEKGEAVPLNLTYLFPALAEGTHRLEANLQDRLRQIETRDQSGQPPDAEQLRQLDLIMGAIAQAYERQTGQRLERIDIRRRDFPVPYRRRAVERELQVRSWERGTQP